MIRETNHTGGLGLSGAWVPGNAGTHAEPLVVNSTASRTERDELGGYAHPLTPPFYVVLAYFVPGLANKDVPVHRAYHFFALLCVAVSCGCLERPVLRMGSCRHSNMQTMFLVSIGCTFRVERGDNTRR